MACPLGHADYPPTSEHMSPHGHWNLSTTSNSDQQTRLVLYPRCDTNTRDYFRRPMTRCSGIDSDVPAPSICLGMVAGESTTRAVSAFASHRERQKHKRVHTQLRLRQGNKFWRVPSINTSTWLQKKGTLARWSEESTYECFA